MKVILSLIFLFTINNTFSFTLNNTAGAAFDKDEVTINLASHSCTNIGVTNDEVLSLVAEAVDRFWNDVATSRLILKAGSQVAVSGDFQTGLVCQTGTNCTPTEALKVGSDVLISCNTNTANFSNSVSVLGVTVPNNISGKNIIGSLILINDQAGNSFAGKSRDEKIAILAHEIGHAIGLGHSKFNDQLMHYQSIPSRERLGWDDVNGISYLYPMDQPVDLGCGSIEFVDGNGNGSNGTFLLTFLAAFLLVAGTSAISGLKKKRTASL